MLFIKIMERHVLGHEGLNQSLRIATSGEADPVDSVTLITLFREGQRKIEEHPERHAVHQVAVAVSRKLLLRPSPKGVIPAQAH